MEQKKKMDAIELSILLNEAGKIKDMGRPPIDDLERLSSKMLLSQHAHIQELEDLRAQELRAYELTVSNLREKVAELERWQETVRSNSPLLAELQRANDRVQELEAQTAHMADLVELADYATKKLEASQAQRVPITFSEIAIAHSEIGAHGQLPVTERLVRWTERRHSIT